MKLLSSSTQYIVELHNIALIVTATKYMSETKNIIYDIEKVTISSVTDITTVDVIHLVDIGSITFCSQIEQKLLQKYDN